MTGTLKAVQSNSSSSNTTASLKSNSSSSGSSTPTTQLSNTLSSCNQKKNNSNSNNNDANYKNLAQVKQLSSEEFLNRKIAFIQSHINNLLIDITNLPEPWSYAVTEDGRVFFIK
jgi:hypothetical protein